MHKVLTVARREYLAAVRTKSFLIALILAPLLMSGGFIAMLLFEGHVDTQDQKLAVVDRSGVVGETLSKAVEIRNTTEVLDSKSGKKVKPAYQLEFVPPDEKDPGGQRLQLSDRVRGKSLHAFLEIGPDVLQAAPESPGSRIRYYADSGALDELRKWIGGPVNEDLRRHRLANEGIDFDQVTNLWRWVPVDSMSLVTVDAQTGSVAAAKRRGEAETIFPPLIIEILMFMLLMMGATPLLQTIMEEKTQRIAEVMLGSVTPFQLMMGKLLGGVAVSLTGSAVYVLSGIITLHSLGLTAFIPYHVLPWFFAYLLSAIFLFGALFAAVGSACADPKDAQLLQLPAMLPMIIPMFLLGPMLREPHSPMATGLSLVPPFAPMLMLLRLSTPAAVPAWQPWLGLLGVILAGAFSVWVGGRIFRVGLLMQGRPAKFSELIRWAIHG